MFDSLTVGASGKFRGRHDAVTWRHKPKQKMKTTGRSRRHLRKRDVRLQVEGGGVTQTLSGVLTRSAGRSDTWTQVRGELREARQSILAFTCGLLLAFLYGLTCLLVQDQPLQVCVRCTLLLAAVTGFSLGLSEDVRRNAWVMLPSLGSGYGRRFVFFLFVSALLSGPVANTLENTERAAASVSCGMELAANQTQELMQRAATPLFSVLERVRHLSRNAYAVAGRVDDFFSTMTDSTRHVARTLRNVLHFLVDIGDVCNSKLGAPYRKCVATLAEARSDCRGLLGEFDFLCNTMDAFLPLCSIARAGELFCVIPSYVTAHLEKHLAAPAVAAFERMKSEFDFNISASVTFDLDTNSSRSLHQLTRDIMEEVTSELQLFLWLTELMVYGNLVLLLCSYLRAASYRRRFLRELDFHNVFITAEFEELDRQVASEGGASVLPITARETKTYINPLSCHLSSREWRAVFVGVASVLRYLVMGGLLVGLDFLVFWTLDQVNHLVKGDIWARAPVMVAVQVNGSGYASDLFKDLVSAFDVLQQGNITVISKKCLRAPSEPNPGSCFTLGFLLGLALLISLSSGFMQRCRRLVCVSLHPEREKERIRFLHQQIQEERRREKIALRRSGGAGGGERGGGSFLQSLLLRLPGGAHLSLSRLGWGEEDKMAARHAPLCPGVVCSRPLTQQEEEEDESVSSISRRTVAMTTRRGASRRVSSSSAGSSDSGLSEADTTHEERPGSDHTRNLQDQNLQAVIVHSAQDQTLLDPAGLRPSESLWV